MIINNDVQYDEMVEPQPDDVTCILNTNDGLYNYYIILVGSSCNIVYSCYV